jgi:hypothetical protein
MHETDAIDDPPQDTPPPQRGPCAHCGRTRLLYPRHLSDERWCGTCLAREARRINTRERYGRGRRGY